MSKKIDAYTIISESKKLGLDIVSYTDASILEQDREKALAWQNSGYAAEMTYMQRSADLLSNPLMLMPEAKSIIAFCMYYERTQTPVLSRGYGRVARYAWGKDYHKVIKKKLKKLVMNLNNRSGVSFNYRIFSDAVPLLERGLAVKAGLGFIGKNSMLIRPKSGSFFFIAEILCDLEISGGSLPVLSENCGTCNNCKVACPTGAIVDDYIIDANKCISYLTIEKRGMFNYWQREAVKDWIFGCDICQDVCPFNHQSLKKEAPPALKEFSRECGAGPELKLSAILAIRTDENFKRDFSGSAIMRAGREGLLRNAAAVAVNTDAECCIASLEEAFMHDSSEVVRSHALWGALSLNRKFNLFSKTRYNRLIDRANADCQTVKDELKFLNA